MPIRENDPRKLEDWMVDVNQRLRKLEARRLDAGVGTQVDYATKQVSAKISDDPGNAASIGEDGGIKATNTVTSATAHTPLYIRKYMTAGFTTTTGVDTNLVPWSVTDATGTWTNDANSITIPEDGHYFVSCTWQWANNPTGLRAIKMTINSTTVTTGSRFSNSVPVVANVEVAHGFAESEFFSAGDVLRIYVFQNSGGNLSGGGPYFGDIRGRWTVFKIHDSFPPELTQTNE